MQIRRGGNPDLEQKHAKILLAGGEKDIWGWGSPAGQKRVCNRVEWITKSCGLRPGVKVMECGCGVGIFSRELAKTGADITAVDIAQDLLEKARQECRAPNVTFTQNNLEAPTLPENSFDVICGISILHHLDVPKALAAFRKLAVSGASFAFSEPNLLNPINKYYLFVNDVAKRSNRGVSPTEMAFRPQELQGLFSDAGFTVEHLLMRDFLHPATPHFFIPLVEAFSKILERLPLLQLLSGSIWIHGTVRR